MILVVGATGQLGTVITLKLVSVFMDVWLALLGSYVPTTDAGRLLNGPMTTMRAFLAQKMRMSSVNVPK